MTKSNLNIADLQNLCEQYSIPYVASNKLYYKRYAYNLTLKHVNLWSHIHRVTMGNGEINDIRELHWQFTKLYKNMCAVLDKKDFEYRTRRELNFNLYFDDPDALKVVLRMVPEHVIELSGPLHEAHLDTMRNSRKLVVRENLWYKKYKFKISYKGTSSFKQDTVPAIIDFKKTVGDNEMKISNNIYRIVEEQTSPQLPTRSRFYFGHRGVHAWNTCSVYFDNEDTFVMYKMMVAGDPHEELEILLVHELDSDK